MAGRLATFTLDELEAIRDVRRRQFCMFATHTPFEERIDDVVAAYRALIEMDAELKRRLNEDYDETIPQ